MSLSSILPSLTFGSLSMSLCTSLYNSYKGAKEILNSKEQANKQNISSEEPLTVEQLPAEGEQVPPSHLTAYQLEAQSLSERQDPSVEEQVNTVALTPKWRLTAVKIGVANGLCNGTNAIYGIATTGIQRAYTLSEKGLFIVNKATTCIQGVAAVTNLVHAFSCAKSLYCVRKDYNNDVSPSPSKGYVFNQVMQGGASLLRATGLTLTLSTGNPLPAVMTAGVGAVISATGTIGKAILESDRCNSSVTQNQPLLTMPPSEERPICIL
jgi:hypothetical protein